MCEYKEMAVDLMVIHRSCSSFRVSVNRCSPAFAAEMIPARWTRESVRVDFPWSTANLRSAVALEPMIIEKLTVGNHGHVPDVGRLVHESTDLPIVRHTSCSFQDQSTIWETLPLRR